MNRSYGEFLMRGFFVALFWSALFLTSGVAVAGDAPDLKDVQKHAAGIDMLAGAVVQYVYKSGVTGDVTFRHSPSLPHADGYYYLTNIGDEKYPLFPPEKASAEMETLLNTAAQKGEGVEVTGWICVFQGGGRGIYLEGSHTFAAAKPWFQEAKKPTRAAPRRAPQRNKGQQGKQPASKQGRKPKQNDPFQEQPISAPKK